MLKPKPLIIRRGGGSRFSRKWTARIRRHARSTLVHHHQINQVEGGPSGDGILLNDGTSFLLLNDDSYILLNG